MITPNLSHSDELSLSRPLAWRRLRPRRFSGPKSVALLYLLSLALAEAVTVFLEPRLGMLLHGLILFALLVQAAISKNKIRYRFLVAMALAPLIRLLSLTMPLPNFPFVYWYLVVGGPLMLSAFMAARLADMNLKRLGLHARGLPLQLLVGVTGLGLGYLEYLILRPDPLAEQLTLQAIWLPALVLLIFTGLLEEIIFRGLLQHTALRLLGRPGFLYVAAVFAILHFGYHSFLDVLFVFAVAIFFGWVVRRTGSIVGVTLSHGLTNISLFLVFPLLLVDLPAPINQPLPVAAPGLASTPTLTPFAPSADTPQAGQSPTEPVALPGILEPSSSPTPTPTPIPATAAASSSPIPSASPTTCGPPAGWVVYFVQSGDTLYALSLAVGLTTTELRTANCLDSDLILTGQALYLPFRLSPTATLVLTATPAPTGAPSQTSPPASATAPAPATAVPTATPAPSATPFPTQTEPPPTATVAPSATAVFTATPSPTSSETPTATPLSTATAAPTRTPILVPTDAITRTPAVLPTLVESPSQP